MGILLTGSVHGYGRAGEYLSEGRAKFTLWPNHLTRREMQDFKESNYFSIVVPFHNPKEEADADTFIFEPFSKKLFKNSINDEIRFMV